MAERRWPDPSGHVLPVLLRPLPLEQIPPYLKSVTLLEPVGNTTACVADTVFQMARTRRNRRLRIAAIAVGVTAVVGAAAWFAMQLRLHHTVDGAPLARIAAGAVVLGDDETTPLRKVYVSAFDMDVFEVTVARYAAFLHAMDGPPPEQWDQLDLQRDGELPVIGVTWREAEEYCKWVGRRLPTEAEWEKAARDGDQRAYPWGNPSPAMHWPRLRASTPPRMPAA
jgi:formylglycine-generating enzyme required for sulfatase activity